jgi:hypothetical protein
MVLGGDVACLRLCLDRIYPPRRNPPIAFNLPSKLDTAGFAKAMAGLLQAIASGSLTPQEAESISRLLAVAKEAIGAAHQAATPRERDPFHYDFGGLANVMPEDVLRLRPRL